MIYQKLYKEKENRNMLLNVFDFDTSKWNDFIVTVHHCLLYTYEIVVENS
jgi:hypothetical protein